MASPPRIPDPPVTPSLRPFTMPLSLGVFTLLCVLGISIGQLLFKKAAAALPETLSLMGLLLNGWILKHAPLHVAYPFMGLAFLIVPTLAWAFLGEPLHWRTLVGGALIVAGVALAAAN